MSTALIPFIVTNLMAGFGTYYTWPFWEGLSHNHGTPWAIAAWIILYLVTLGTLFERHARERLMYNQLQLTDEILAARERATPEARATQK